MNTITPEKLNKYFAITKEALDKAEKALDSSRLEQARDFLNMASHYFSDAHYFAQKEDLVNAFACLNYAHGWLDAGARIQLFKVHDSRLFTVDD
ncbi:DUF357 domain-containing protein [Candidatus Woesearchaeota archaeon]|nr:DUF357 domain-containing protein [Candidatus Woesearchaeota archaeon]